MNYSKKLKKDLEINPELDFDMCESITAHPSKECFLTSPVSIKDQSWSDSTIPFVSVVCKTYMHENYIRKCLEGFLIQKTTFPVEILINDDASTDRTTQIINEFQTKYPKLFKTTFQTENQYKRNPKTPDFIKPLKKQGKYIAKCEGDDYWTDPMKLQKQVEILEANPTFSACFTNAQVVNE
jgi:glycosyltransferase involved in cell wall biosynthesis